MAWTPMRGRQARKRGMQADDPDVISALPASTYLWKGMICCVPALVLAYFALFVPIQVNSSSSDPNQSVASSSQSSSATDSSRSEELRPVWQDTAPIKPKDLSFKSGLLVEDRANILESSIRGRMDFLLKSVEASTTNQIGILTITSLGGQSIEEWSIGAARKWALGQAEKDNGIMLFLASEDRQLRIEVGRGLEATLTDLQCHRIIEDVMVPRLKAGQRNAAIVDGIDAILAVVAPEFQGPHSEWYAGLEDASAESAMPAISSPPIEYETFPVCGFAYIFLFAVLMVTGWQAVAKSQYIWFLLPTAVVAVFALYSTALAMGAFFVSLVCLIAITLAIYGKSGGSTTTSTFSTSSMPSSSGRSSNSSSGGGGKFGGGGASGKW